MELFNRSKQEFQLFEDISDDTLSLFLKQRLEMKEIWEKNPNNTISFDRLIDELTSMPVNVYFQKQKKDEKTDRLRQRLVIQIADERAVELRTSLWTINKDAFSQSFALLIGKFREIDFFNPPKKDTISKKCKIRLVGPNETIGSSDSAFTNLLRDIEALQIPTQELNKTSADLDQIC